SAQDMMDNFVLARMERYGDPQDACDDRWTGLATHITLSASVISPMYGNDDPGLLVEWVYGRPLRPDEFIETFLLDGEAFERVPWNANACASGQYDGGPGSSPKPASPFAARRRESRPASRRGPGISRSKRTPTSLATESRTGGTHPATPSVQTLGQLSAVSKELPLLRIDPLEGARVASGLARLARDIADIDADEALGMRPREFAVDLGVALARVPDEHEAP